MIILKTIVKKVILITFVLVCLFRNSNDSNDLEFDPTDNGEPIYFNEKLEIYDNILEVIFDFKLFIFANKILKLDYLS